MMFGLIALFTLNSGRLIMKFEELFNQVQSEFDTDIALLVVGMCILNIAEPVQTSDWKNSHTYTYETRCINKFDDVFWEQKQYHPERYELAIKLWGCIHDWDTGQDMDGLGGCERKTFKQLLGEE